MGRQKKEVVVFGNGQIRKRTMTGGEISVTQCPESVMTQCGYESVFYRVFCATLLAIALTFTVILTNVFIDIDSLLATKEIEKPEDPITTTTASSAPIFDKYQDIDVSEDMLYEQQHGKDSFEPDLKGEPQGNEVFKTYDMVPFPTLPADLDSESNDLRPERDEDYRTKRSIVADVPDIKIRLTNPKMKEILNNRLSTLLEELDAEESQANEKNQKQKKQESIKSAEITNNIKNNNKEEIEMIRKEDNEVLHKAMHDIFLQGIIGHMDMNDVYTKIHNMIHNFEVENDDQLSRKSFKNPGSKGKNNPELEKLISAVDNSPETLSEVPPSLFSVEDAFFNELVKCDKLQKQIKSGATSYGATKRAATKKVDIIKVPKILIRTVIDIKSMSKNDSKVHANNIKGLIKLIYNGKSINFSRMEDEERNIASTTVLPKVDYKAEISNPKNDVVFNDEENVVDHFLDKALAQYLKKYPILERKLQSKRPKRSVKIHKHSTSLNTEKPKEKKQDDEELYVEIETHFDSNGVKGEKKKKLVKAIIEKIRKALRVNVDTLQKGGKNNKKSEMLQIKKRVQNPLKINAENSLSNKILLPVEGIILRHSEPISKSVKINEPMPKVYDKMGEIWGKTYTGSNFLSNAKSINSGEMGLVDLDYSRVLKGNGIPQRLQQPLTSGNFKQGSDNNNNYYNLGDLKFYVKEIDGTGFSIGFNQYVGDAPDPESIKVFTGLQQLMSAFNQNENKNETNLKNSYSADTNHEVTKRDVHSVNKLAKMFHDMPITDHHSNVYKVIFDENYLPYDTYSEIFEDGRKKVTFSLEKENKEKQQEQSDVNKETNLNQIKIPVEIEDARTPQTDMPFFIDENIFKKTLKPSEIFSIADLLNRKKRSPIVKVKKYSNLNTKSHLNKYLNTKRKSKKIIKNRRNKRQVDKIRIIATDGLPHMSRHSDENYFVVSDENMFADRAVLRELDMPEQEQSDHEERNEFILPHHISNQLSPYNIFGARSRHNALMSKYPHLFLEEITRSKEEDNPMFYSKLMDNYSDLQKNIEPTQLPYTMSTPYEMPESPYPSINRYRGNELRPNYKLTVKIIPKNHTVTPSGFKSVHTSINKTINRNGMLFLSQVNVSELSKVQHMNGDQNSLRFSSQIYIPDEPKRNLTEQTQNNSGQKVTDTITPRPMRINVNADTFPLVKHIKEQQEQMKMLLKQHKQRIDEQLDNLKQEKQNIDSMIIRGMSDTTTTTPTPPEVKNVETIDVLLPLNPPQMLHLNKEEAGQLISNALMKLHDAPHLNDISGRNQLNLSTMQVPLTTPSTTTTQATTTAPPLTQAPVPKKTIDPERLKLLRTIQRNENLTNVILYKIDRNTNLLQHFLQKLTERLEATTNRPERTPVPVSEKRSKKETKEWRDVNDPFFTHTLPNMGVNKNASHVSIPFVYAYQQPYPLPSPNNPIASVVYQGHIHTNAFNNGFTKNNVKTDKRDANNTKFFLDDLEPGFKLSRLPIRKEPYEIPRIKNNITTEYSKN